MYGGLASTGVGGFVIFGHVVGLNYVVGGAVAAVVAGIGLVRVSSRKLRRNES